MFCSHIGTSLGPNARFCSSCATQVHNPTQPTHNPPSSPGHAVSPPSPTSPDLYTPSPSFGTCSSTYLPTHRQQPPSSTHFPQLPPPPPSPPSTNLKLVNNNNIPTQGFSGVSGS
ncbi:hypothetical protein BCR39DRAFT_556409 [Naematelia encephala]|uniref:Zinc-ribbon domain-containing protein n=1 Tax=Naematelia encephala TaxID=71784 RepID=A0A1Y2BLC2_9TREE|nr:hypothetical protein BCR39DRAFT_556409 [Naematelia encephala]